MTRYFSPFKSLMVLALVAGSALAFAFSYVISAPFIGLTFTEFAAAMSAPMLSLAFMIATVGVAMFFKAKIEAFISSVLNTPLDRYANRAI